MKWSIHQLSKYRQTGMPIDANVQLDDVMERNQDIRQISPVHVKGQCTFGASQMTLSFNNFRRHDTSVCAHMGGC